MHISPPSLPSSADSIDSIYLAFPSTSTSLNGSNYSDILSGSRPRAGGPPILYTRINCCCCGNSLAYPRGSFRIQCGVPDCAIIITVKEVDSIELDFQKLDLSETGKSLRDEGRLKEIFRSCGTVERYFGKGSDSIEEFYTNLELQEAGLEVLREVLWDFLRDPGSISLGSSWIIALLECPLLLSQYNSDAEERRELLTKIVGLLSQLPNTTHHEILDYYSSNIPSLSSKIQLLVALLTAQFSFASNYKTNWIVKSTARVTSILFAAAEDSKLDLSIFYCSILDSLDKIALENEFIDWENGHEDFNLLGYPFLLSLGLKVRLLQFEAERQMREASRAYSLSPSPFLSISVRREHIVEDSIRAILDSLELKKALRVTFVNEEGIDYGGPRKEFFLLLIEKLFDPKFGMFVLEENGKTWFSPNSFELEEFFLVGSIIGMALYNGIQIDLPLDGIIFAILLGKRELGLEELKAVKPDLARGLEKLLEFEGASVEETFSRAFVGEYESYGELVTQELFEGGTDILVTKENRIQFVELYSNWALFDVVSTQINSFQDGFFSVADGNMLSCIRAKELAILITGNPSKISIDDLNSSTIFEGNLDEFELTIRDFWLILEEFSDLEMRAFLAFVTGSSRLPIGKSDYLLKVVLMGTGDGKEQRLPTTKTCFSQLNLWSYSSIEVMREKLVLAIGGSIGFDLK